MFSVASVRPVLAVSSRGRCRHVQVASRPRCSVLRVAILALHDFSLRISFAVFVGEVVAVVLTAAEMFIAASFASKARMLN